MSGMEARQNGSAACCSKEKTEGAVPHVGNYCLERRLHRFNATNRTPLKISRMAKACIQPKKASPMQVLAMVATTGCT